MSFAAARLGVRAMHPFTATYKVSALRASAARARTIMASTAPADQPKVNTTASEFYVLQYSYIPDILEKRGPHREKHLAAAKEWGQKGKLVLAGALQEPVDGAPFVFKGASVEEIESFVAADPYVTNALVTDSSVRPLATVVAP